MDDSCEKYAFIMWCYLDAGWSQPKELLGFGLQTCAKKWKHEKVENESKCGDSEKSP